MGKVFNISSIAAEKCVSIRVHNCVGLTIHVPLLVCAHGKEGGEREVANT